MERTCCLFALGLTTLFGPRNNCFCDKDNRGTNSLPSCCVPYCRKELTELVLNFSTLENLSFTNLFLGSAVK